MSNQDVQVGGKGRGGGLIGTPRRGSAIQKDRAYADAAKDAKAELVARFKARLA